LTEEKFLLERRVVNNPRVRAGSPVLASARRENVAASPDIVKVIEQRLQEIEEQLASYDELVRERDRVRRALGELRADSTAPRPADDGRAATGRRVARRRGSGRRAKRGSNVTAIVGYVAAHPGSTAAEIAAGTGIDRSVVYSATSRLASAGRLRRAPKGDRQVGYEPAAA
jgi:IclR helix-turn-helix domain